MASGELQGRKSKAAARAAWGARGICLDGMTSEQGGRLARAWISLTVNTTLTNTTLRLTILTVIRYALLDPRK
ncbi:hypothetical protein BM1_06451 [Bipolaris maydis]|nr:hypothetical protein BM1_06451 [Bipolaris maydis]